jgi:excisionase family DNA binding protein
MDLEDLRASRSAVVTVAQAASIFGVDVRTVSRAIQTGELPVLRLGRRILIPRIRLLELLGVDGGGEPDAETAPTLNSISPRDGQRGVPDR